MEFQTSASWYYCDCGHEYVLPSTFPECLRGLLQLDVFYFLVSLIAGVVMLVVTEFSFIWIICHVDLIHWYIICKEVEGSDLPL